MRQMQRTVDQNGHRICIAIEMPIARVDHFHGSNMILLLLGIQTECSGQETTWDGTIRENISSLGRAYLCLFSKEVPARGCES